MQLQACQPVQTNQAAGYYPEMGEVPAERVFHDEHNFDSTYSLCWKVDDDDAARAALRKLRIRVTVCERHTPTEWDDAQRLGCDVFACVITREAHRKLCDAELVSTRMLLD